MKCRGFLTTQMITVIKCMPGFFRDHTLHYIHPTKWPAKALKVTHLLASLRWRIEASLTEYVYTGIYWIETIPNAVTGENAWYHQFSCSTITLLLNILLFDSI
jgi:hypothetical protein